MTNDPKNKFYEVRVTHSYTNYYHIEAKNEEEAKDLIRQKVIEEDSFIEARINDTIPHTPKVDYAVQITPDGEVILWFRFLK